MRKLLGLVTAVMAVLAFGPAAAQAAIHHVCPSGCTYTSINDAVAASSAGDTIAVDPGVYTELVTVDKDVTIEGAKHGVDARTGRTDPTQESVLNSTDGGFNVLASGATIDGFTVQDATSDVSSIGAGIATSAAGGGYTIVNNILTNNPMGIYLNAASGALVRGNRFVGNNRPTSASGNGIYADQGTVDASIVQNKFTNHENTSILVIGGSNLGISGNTMDHDATILPAFVTNVDIVGNTISYPRFNAIQVFGVTDADIVGNKVNNAEWTALRLSGGSSDVVANNNTFRNSGDYGVRMTVGDMLDSPQVHFNNIVNNVTGELYNDDTGVLLNAENNYYGCTKKQVGCPRTLGGGLFDISPMLSKTVQVK